MGTKQEDLLDEQDDLDDDDEGEDGGEGGDAKGGKSDEKFDEARARKTIENQRKAERALKKEVQDLKATLKAIQDKDLPAAEKQRKDLEDAQAALAEATRRSQKSALKAEVLEQATKLKFRSPTLASRLIDPDDVDWDDDGAPTNVVQLLKEILDEDPSLRGRVRRTTTDEEDEDEEGEGNGRSTKGAKNGADFMNRSIRKAAGR